MYRHAAHIRRLLLGRYLLVTNTVSGCVLDALADATEQRCVERTSPHDWPRTLRMGTAGLLFGPFDHYWYTLLDKRLPGRHAAVIAKKLSLDLFVYGPIGVAAFFLLLCMLEGKSWKEAVAETKQKFAATYELDLLLWPAAQIINFRYVPASLRVIFQNVIDLVWSMILSYLKHHELSKTHIWEYWT